MSNWIFLSGDNTDEYIEMLAQSCGGKITNTNDFVYKNSSDPIVLRGILKYKIMKQCWRDSRDFYYIDSGYFGNHTNPKNPEGKKLYHRIVKNDIQHGEIIPRPDDRWKKLGIPLSPRRHGSRIIIALPDEKPCKFYGIDRQSWIDEVLEFLKSYTDRPIILRDRAHKREDRVLSNPLSELLKNDVHALVTFNSVAAIESILLGVPAFVMSPTHAASPVANTDLAMIENPYWAPDDKLYAWACHLAYGQYHIHELRNGTAYRMLNASC